MKKSWFQKEDERKRKETENATDVIGELFGKVLELVKGTSGEKDEEKDESGGRDDEDERRCTDRLRKMSTVEHYTEEEQEEQKKVGIRKSSNVWCEQNTGIFETIVARVHQRYERIRPESSDPFAFQPPPHHSKLYDETALNTIARTFICTARHFTTSVVSSVDSPQ